MTPNFKRLIRYPRRKFLLGVFKIKRYARAWFGTRRLDYAPKNISISTDTIREYETRARSVRKEPGTVSWIERHGGEGAVLYDIGANIGAYTLIAAARGAAVVAFEPAHQNIYKLHENLLLNGLQSKVTVVPLVLAAHGGVAESFVENKGFGATHSFSFNEQTPDTAAGRPFPATTLDECMRLFSLPAPTMIKIDVDGAEIDVLNGAQKLLAAPALKTLLIETEDATAETVRQMCADAGFRLAGEERSGESTINYIFERRATR